MSSSPPSPPPAALLHALGQWRRDRRGAVVAAVAIVAVGTAAAVLRSAAAVGAGDAPGLRGIVTGAVTAAALTALLLTTLTHVGVARTRWLRHVGRYPGLLLETLRIGGAGVRLLGGLLGGAAVATFLHPVLALALAALALGVLPTEVGRAVAAWRTAGGAARARVAGRRSAVDPDRWRLTAVALALGTAPVATLRLLVLDPACDLDRWLGGGCPDGAVATTATTVAVALAAVAVTPLAIGLGDVLSRTLDGERLATSVTPVPRHVDAVPATPAPPPAAPPASDTAPEPEAGPGPDVVDEVPPLWPDDRPVAAPPVADAGRVGSGRSGDDEGEPTVELLPVRPPAAEAGPGPAAGSGTVELRRALDGIDGVDTREALSLVRSNAGHVGALRAQYQRSPRIARAAIERAASVGFRDAGLPGEQAGSLARALLTMDDRDWAHLPTALDAMEDELGGG